MRVFLLVVVALLILALGGLEVVASRHLTVGDSLSNAPVSTPGLWR